MSKLIGTLAFFFTLLLSATAAHAAVTDCSTGCFVYLKDDGVHFINKDTGIEEGVVTNVGTGNGVISAGSNGYVFVARQNGVGVVWIIDTKTGGKCSINTGATGQSAIDFGGYAYFTAAGDNVAKVALDCSSAVLISVGANPYGITKDSATLYILNTDNGTISTIVPPAETATTYSIGLSGGDSLVDIEYRASNNKLYLSGFSGIYEVDLPLSLGTSVLYQALPQWGMELDISPTHLATNSILGNVAYLIPFSDSSTYSTIGCTSCANVALNDNTLYTSSNGGVEAWDMSAIAQSYSPVNVTPAQSVAYLPPFTPLGPVCQNGVKEAGEECDQSDFGSSTCGTEGFDGGSLSCSASCTIETTSCTYTCGNNVAAPTEECDGSDLKGQDCTTLGMGFGGGTLTCNPGTCTLNNTACTLPPFCNDGNVDTGEDCDGANLDNATCESEGYHHGTLACTLGCAFDYSGCSNCGNGTADAGEDCDGADLNGQDCTDQGFSSGTLGCTTACTYDASSCVLNSCNNGVIDIGETCDDGNNTSGDGCSNVCQVENGWACSGTPSTCTQLCGNGSIDTGEECDGSNLNNANCGDFGGEGNLTCKSDCTLDTTGCLMCNDPQLVYDITVNDVDQTKLNGHNAELFTSNLSELTEANGDRISCGDFEVAGQTVPSVVVSLEAAEYKLVRISGNGYTSNCMFFSKTGPAKLYVNITDPKKTRIDNTSTGTGLICIHSGNNVQFQIGGLLLGTLGTAFSLQYLTFNPKAQQDGSWAEIFVSTDGVNLLEMANPLNNGDLFVANFTDGAKYINLLALGDTDLDEIGRKPQPPDCNCSTTEPGAAPILLLVIIFLVWSWRRSRRLSPQRIVLKRHDQ